MKIGLARHFKAAPTSQKVFVNSAEFSSWVEDYETSGVERNDMVELLQDWPVCICSSSNRAIQTAILSGYAGIEKNELIKEVPIAPLFETNFRLPLAFWLAAGRIAWLFSHHSRPEPASETVKRVRKFVSAVLSSGDDEDILVISHGFVMHLIRKELVKAGFRGRRLTAVKNGALHFYKR